MNKQTERIVVAILIAIGCTGIYAMVIIDSPWLPNWIKLILIPLILFFFLFMFLVSVTRSISDDQMY